MSYILDALRKADHERERERGAVPGINAQPMPPTASDSDPEDHRNRQPLVWAVAGLSVIVLALLAWLFMGRDPAGSDDRPDRATTQTPGPQHALMPQPGAVPPVAPVAPVAPVPPLASRADHAPPGALPQPVPAQPAYLPEPAPARPAPPAQRADPLPAQRVEAPPAPVVAAAPMPAMPVQQQPAGPVKNGNAGAAADHVMSMDELPEDIRRQLPNFAINGSKYSDTPASRMLIINGQVFREGDRLAPDLMLEQIKIKEAVLRFRGYRYSMTF